MILLVTVSPPNGQLTRGMNRPLSGCLGVSRPKAPKVTRPFNWAPTRRSPDASSNGFTVPDCIFISTTQRECSVPMGDPPESRDRFTCRKCYKKALD
ncbi:hypothetical protein AVEN_262157-1 [Araneus ventricosus]|uniref:Uncharacterized protein n=1 Tax=Araneus ventricosus TaxID=182803 RepID=A0A4Y2EHX8_ARAVE|nr:hypothetical protein AVEN_262157-1 [Araneus ventricosus]